MADMNWGFTLRMCRTMYDVPLWTFFPAAIIRQPDNDFVPVDSSQCGVLALFVQKVLRKIFLFQSTLVAMPFTAIS